MANRRMISRTVIDTDKFAMMSLNARYLYFELLVRADDDGFLGAPMRIVRMVGCTEADMDELERNGYIIKFNNGIVVIRDWKIHNTIRKDMYKKTLYQEEFNMLREINSRYYLLSELGDNVTDGVTSNVTLSKGKKSKGKRSNDNTFTSLTLQEGDAPPPSAGAGGAHTFTFTEVQECAEENGIDLSDEGITAFYKWMEKYDWKINGRKVTKLENALSGYAKKHPRYSLDQEEPERPKAAQPEISQKEKDLRHSIIEKTDDYMTFEIKSICSSKGMLWVQCIPDYCPKDIFTDEELDYLAEKFDVEWD